MFKDQQEGRRQKTEVRSQRLEVRKTLLTLASFLLLIIIGISSQTATAASTEEIMGRLQTTYSGIEDFTVIFTQRSSIKGLGEKVFEGKLYVKKPKMIRWDYSRPAKQNIYINGKTAILYLPDQKQAIKQDLSKHPDAEPALGLLSNIEKWQDIFTIKSEGPTGNGFQMNLTPKNMFTVEKVLVEIDKESFLISKLTLFENGGNKVSFNFSNINTNSGLKDKLFNFKIPKGVEILEY